MSLLLFPIPSAASTNFEITIFSAVSFKEPNSKIAVTLKSPALFKYKPVTFPSPSLSCLRVAEIAVLSSVFIRP